MIHTVDRAPKGVKGKIIQRAIIKVLQELYKLLSANATLEELGRQTGLNN